LNELNAPSLASSAQRSSLWNQAHRSTTGTLIKVLLIVGSSVPLPAREPDWTGFRGPQGQGVSPAKVLPISWSANDNIAWKTSIPGPGASSPIQIGERIYLTCYSGFFVPGQDDGRKEDLKRHLIALERATGTILWNSEVKARLPEEDTIRDHGFAASTPAADSQRVYVFFGKTGVFAFDHDGKQVWHADVGSKTDNWGSAASPVLYKDKVFINASVESGALYALNRETGKELWRANGIEGSWNSPILVRAASGRDELVLATQGSIKAFDPETGESLWTCETDIGWYMVPGMVSDGDMIYCLGGRSGVAGLAVRAGGTGNVTKTHRRWTILKGSNVSSPVFHDGHLYWMNDKQGKAFCANAETGEILYEKRLDHAGEVYASALQADGRLYYLTRDGRTFVVAARPEFEQLSENDLGDGSVFNGTPAVSGNQLLIRSDKFLYCIGQ
jgi:outer membrane protein assembly factor BamB